MSQLTPAQRRKIFAVTRELGWDEDMLYAAVKSITTKDHISELTKFEAAGVIDSLEAKIRPRSVTKAGKKIPLATKKQLWLMHKLEQELGWQYNPKRLQGFCRKYAGIDNVDWLTRDQAWRVIEGLKALVARDVS